MGVYFFILVFSGAYELPYFSQNMAFITQKNKSWATSNLCLCYLSSLVTRIYQYSKMTDMGLKVSRWGSTISKHDSIWEVRFGAGTSAEKIPPLPGI